VAWGARCLNADCSETRWERIDGYKTKLGVWNANAQRCDLTHLFYAQGHHYKTLNIDTIASVQDGAQTQRKRARVVMRAEKDNGRCFSGSAGTSAPPVRTASQPDVTYEPQTTRRTPSTAKPGSRP
jgi:hypothetical protein